ncbi:hypothetical protein QNI16_24965 [Cytophagaceae bacterium YF14B1]|uniref:Uncharacterized protein n=1 Tax=Xanthocytophaga flava TaxID=3048013 RepID=A0AAE3QV03_9BACT|nr:hypothetical protein [Xanthocytophaga flavus]MDJ1483775.1 hypothetical protein [Xanthocytophaga flavus]
MKYLFLTLWIVCLSSCSKDLKPLYSEQSTLTQENIHQLNGCYSSVLWRYIAPLAKTHYSTDTNTYKVCLVAKDNKCIVATLKEGDSIIATQKLKGHIKNGYFSARSKVYPLGIPPLFFLYYNTDMKIAFANSDDLYTEIHETRFGWVLLFAHGGNSDTFYKVYKKESF